MKKISIKTDKHLRNIAVVLIKTIPDTVKFIEQCVLEAEPYIDDCCNAGDNLFSVLYNSEANLKDMLKKNFPPETWDDFSKLTLWGVEEDCPDCGCEMRVWGFETNEDGFTGRDVFRCTNCGEEQIR